MSAKDKKQKFAAIFKKSKVYFLLEAIGYYIFEQMAFKHNLAFVLMQMSAH